METQLDRSLSALGFNIPDSLEVDFYVRDVVGPGQPVQLRLNMHTATRVWQAGKLKQGLPTTLVLSDSDDDLPDISPRPVTGTLIDGVEREVVRESVSSYDSGSAPTSTLPWPASGANG